MATEILSVTTTTPTVSVMENDSHETRQTNPGPNKNATTNSSQKQIEDLVHDLNKSMQDMDTQISFSVDNDTKHVVIKVIDTATNEIIRQIPPEEILRVSENIKKLLGVRVDQAV